MTYRIFSLWICLALGVGSPLAAQQREKSSLTATGEKLQAQYAATLKSLQVEIASCCRTCLRRRRSTSSKHVKPSRPPRRQRIRAQWVSRVLGEQEFNDRKRVAGGFWSNMAHYQTRLIAINTKAVALGPLGQELGEANESEATKAKAVAKVAITAADQKPIVSKDGAITIPSVAHSKPTGPFAAMKSFSGGLQLHASGGFKAQYVIDAPQAGKYTLAARVATVHEGQKFLFSVNDVNSAVEVAVPYTIGMWQQSNPVEVVLIKGRNVLQVALKEGSRGVAIKDITLTPMK